jgi:hypothetical protein
MLVRQANLEKAILKAERPLILATVESLLKFGLFQGDAQIGTISAGPVTNRLKDITVDLPDEQSHEIQVFLLLLLVRKWSDTSYT